MITTKFLPKIFIAFLFAFPFHKAIAQNPYELLWEISGNGLEKPSYILGSLHVADERAFLFPDSLLFFLDQCKIFAMEVHPDSLTSYFSDKLKREGVEYELQEMFDRIRLRTEYAQFNERGGIPLSISKNKDPDVFQPMITGALYKGNHTYPCFLDAYLCGVAADHGKRIESLESMSSQLLVLHNNDADEIEMLRQKNLRLAFHTVYMNKMMDVYNKGDLRTICQVIDEEDSIFRSTILIRNTNMAKAFEKLSKEGQTFAVAGSAHLCGSYGFIEILRSMGFTARPVSSGTRQAPEDYTFTSPLAEIAWTEFTDSADGFKVSLPGKVNEIYTGIAMSKSYYYSDLTHGIHFVFLSTDLPNYTEGNEDETKYFLWGRNVGMLGRMGVYDPTFDYDGSGGEKSGYSMGTNEESGEKVRLKTFLKDNKIYIFVASYHPSCEGSPKIDNFFESIQFIQRAKGGFQPFQSKNYGFEIRFPSGATQTKSKLQTEEGEIGVLMVSGKDISSGDMYMIQMIERDGKSTIVDDSATFAGMTERLETKQYGEFEIVDRNQISGFPSLQYAVSKKGIPSLTGRIILRGDRIFHFFCAFEEHDREKNLEKADVYFNSIKLNTYPSIQVSPQKQDEFHFEMMLPGPLEVLSRDTITSWSLKYNGGLKYVTTLSVRDSISGTLFLINVNEFSEFASFDNEDSLWKEIDVEDLYSELLLSSETSVSAWKPPTGTKSLEISGQMESTHKYCHTRNFLAGKYFVQLQVILEADLAERKAHLKSFDSFHLTEDASSFDPYSKKITKIFDLLPVGTESEIEDALVFLRDYPVDSSELLRIKQALRFKYKEESEQEPTYKIRTALLEKYSEIKDPYHREFIDSLWDSMNVHLKVRSLSLILESGEKEDFKMFLEKIKKVEDDSLSWWEQYTLFSPLKKKPVLVKEIWEDILPRIDKEIYRDNFTDALLNATDSGYISLEKVIPFKTKIENVVMEVQSKYNLKNEDDRTHSWDNSNFLDLLSRLPGDTKTKEIYATEIKGDNDYNKVLIIPALLRDGIPIQPDTLQRIASDIYHRVTLYERMKMQGVEKYFPEKLSTQEHLAKGYFYNYVNEEGEELIIKITGKVDEVSGGKTERYYSVKFRYTYDDEYEQWYAGICGPFSIDPKILTTDCEGCNVTWELAHLKYSPKALLNYFKSLKEEEQ